jgi:peptidoglycan/xylan/chitin deacetylase (PgdA/CDA1 family)
MSTQFLNGLSKVKPALRGIAAQGLHHSGILSAVLRHRLRDRAVVLMYHRVLPEQEIRRCPSHPGIVVSTEEFDRQMVCLRHMFQPLSPEYFLETLEARRPFPSMSCLVTFDDGWQDNRVYAQQILEAHGIPALIFLPTGYIGTSRQFWRESLVEMIHAARRLFQDDPMFRKHVLSEESLAALRPCLSGTRDSSRKSVDRLTSMLKRKTRKEIDVFLEKLSTGPLRSAAAELSSRDFLDWEAVREMSGHGIRFGSHGVNHRILTGADTDIEYELGQSRRILAERLGEEVPMVAYPNGDYSPAVVKGARNAGYRAAFTTAGGYVSRESDPLALPRFNIHQGVSTSLPMFLSRLAGLW